MHAHKQTTARHGEGDVVHQPENLYGQDEMEFLRGELLEAYTTAREKMITRDQANTIKKIQFADEENRRMTVKKAKEEDVELQLRAKQEALRRLYENVLIEKEKRYMRGKKQKRDRSSEGSGSFHEMYMVYRDPEKHHKESHKAEGERLVRGSPPKETDLKVIDSTVKPPEDVRQSMRKTMTKERSKSKFGLKSKRSTMIAKPPPLVTSKHELPSKAALANRRDVRFSDDQGRYSFDVDVKGPFMSVFDPLKPKSTVRNIGVQALVIDGQLADHLKEKASQTEMEMTHYNINRYSAVTDSSAGYGGIDSIPSPEDEEALAGGDASSSNPSEKDEEEHDLEAEEEDPGKVLERKESKRREAEVMARPRGYLNLDLNEKMPFVTFEAETSVTPYDLEKELARQRGVSLSRDNILWPSSGEFQMEMALKKIEDYIKRCWNLDSKWLFVVNPLEVYHDNYRRKYVFEVKFSVPSPATPVPSATASVFFVFEIPLYAAKNDKIMVTYVLEGTRFAHRPGKVVFQDKWLWAIITDKLRVQKAVNF
ncbi:A-kinase anchor protein 14 [Orchesella cincta]|uniref:A-kinase anchor protein 14 n=1 Tax=Orchesella cincta TaxID=48709 RepID=A0A1D2MUR0_ORCCI|nr:A-kinase anchor protein 14 [Orchesella cincta]